MANVTDGRWRAAPAPGSVIGRLGGLGFVIALTLAIWSAVVWFAHAYLAAYH